MTDEAVIIKAWERCSDGSGTGLIRATIDLINRLQADKDALIAGQETLQKALEKEIKKREVQAKRLREEREQKYTQADLLCKLKHELAEKDAETEAWRTKALSEGKTTATAIRDELLARRLDAERIEKLREIVAEQDAEIKKLQKFKAYFDSLYGTGLEVAFFHQNGELESFDNFYDSATKEMAGVSDG